MDFRYSSESNFASFQVHPRFKMLNFSHSHRKSKWKHIFFMLSGYCNSGKRAHTQYLMFFFSFFPSLIKYIRNEKEWNYGIGERRMLRTTFRITMAIGHPENWDIRTKYSFPFTFWTNNHRSLIEKEPAVFVLFWARLFVWMGWTISFRLKLYSILHNFMPDIYRV